MRVRPIFSESAWLTWVRRLAGLTAESRENTLMPAAHGLREHRLQRVEVVAHDADRGHFLGDQLLEDLDLRLGRRLVGRPQDGLEALLLDAGLEAAHLLVAVGVARVLEHDGVLCPCLPATSPPPANSAGSRMAMIAAIRPP